MNKIFGNSWLLLSLILPSLLVTLPTQISPPVLAQSTQQPTQQQRRDIERAVIQKIRVAGLPSPRVEKITLQGQYGLATWLMGEAGGMVALNFDRGSLQVVPLGGGVPGAIGISKASAIPLPVVEQLLNRHLGITQSIASSTALPMEIVFDEGTAAIVVPDRDTSLPAYGGQLRRYDVHIAKMFEVTHFLCQQRMVGGSIEWGYYAGRGSIDMGKFSISCNLANDLAAAYGLGKPEFTTISFSQGEGQSPKVRSNNIPIFEITGNKVPKWMNFVQGFRPRK